MASPPPKRRFENVSEEDIEEILDGRTPQSTKTAAKFWCVFDKFVKENDLECNLNMCTEETLADVLSKYYAGMRRHDGKPYQRNSYTNFRAAVNRFMSDRGFDLMEGAMFKKSNQVFDGVIKKLKREGLFSPVQLKDRITPSDMGKIKDTFARDKTPVSLLRQAWFYITLHFSLRGREVQSKMVKSDLKLCKDEKGDDFITLTTDFCTKNHQSDSSKDTAGHIQNRDQVLVHVSLLNTCCVDTDV